MLSPLDEALAPFGLDLLLPETLGFHFFSDAPALAVSSAITHASLLEQDIPLSLQELLLNQAAHLDAALSGHYNTLDLTLQIDSITLHQAQVTQVLHEVKQLTLETSMEPAVETFADFADDTPIWVGTPDEYEALQPPGTIVSLTWS